MKTPLVTVGIINYNYSNYILQALNSVNLQNYHNIEIIIIDDFSKDESVNIINNWIKENKQNQKINFIVNNVNQGLTKNCNTILKIAQGKYFQILDADDIILPNKISAQVEILENNSDCSLVYTKVSVINENGNIIRDNYFEQIGYGNRIIPSGKIFDDLLEFNFIPLPSVLLNTTAAKNIGGFDETMQVQDYYMWLKLSKNFNFIFYPHVTAYYRVHSGSMSNHNTTKIRSYDDVLNIKFSYYFKTGKKGKKFIANEINLISKVLYRFGYTTAKKWLFRSFLLQPSLKTFFILVSVNLGIRYDFFQTLKKSIYN